MNDFETKFAKIVGDSIVNKHIKLFMKLGIEIDEKCSKINFIPKYDGIEKELMTIVDKVLTISEHEEFIVELEAIIEKDKTIVDRLIEAGITPVSIMKNLFFTRNISITISSKFTDIDETMHFSNRFITE